MLALVLLFRRRFTGDLGFIVDSQCWRALPARCQLRLIERMALSRASRAPEV